MGYGGRVSTLAALLRPRTAFAAAVQRDDVRRGAAVVLASGVASLAFALAASALAGVSVAGLVSALLLPVLFLGYWLLQGWLVDAAARTLQRAGRTRTFLAVSALAFPTWITYAVLSLLESAAVRAGGSSGPALAAALSWLTLPALAWFVVLTVLAIRAVYDVPLLHAVAFAFLPYAVLLAALLVLGVALGMLHGARLI